MAAIYAFSFLFVYGLANESNRKKEKIVNYDQRKANLPPTRNNAKSDIDKFFNEKGKTKIIVFDVETNGLDKGYSVLSCSAIKYEIDPKTYKAEELERFDRFYFPVEGFNPEATNINGLTREVISEKRVSVFYPEHFRHDTDFKEFCEGVIRFVAHNVSFDMRFIPFLKRKKTFCTMKTNTDIVAVEFLQWKNDWKWPKLAETASFYKIKFNENDLHSSMGDTELTAQIFLKMCKAIKYKTI